MRLINASPAITGIIMSLMVAACSTIPSNPDPQQQECLSLRNQITFINATRTNQSQFQINAQRQNLQESYEQNQCYQVLPNKTLP